MLVAVRRDGRALGGPQQGSGRLLHADDRRARALEGQQRQHLLDARPRRLDRRRAAAPGRAEADARVHPATSTSRRGKKIRLDECAQMRLYEHATTRFWRQHPGREAQADAAGDADALGSAADPDGERPRGRRQPAPPHLGRGLVRDPALPARAPRSRRRPPPLRRARSGVPRLRDAGGDAVRRARRATACPGTSCSPCSQERRSTATSVWPRRESAAGRARRSGRRSGRARTPRARARRAARPSSPCDHGLATSSTIAAASAAHVTARDEEPGAAVRDDLGQPADCRGDHGPAPLLRLERAMPKPSPSDGTTTTAARS